MNAVTEMAPKKQNVERRITTGNLWTIATMVAGLLGSAGYQHYHPSEAAEDAKSAAQAAVTKAEDSAAKSALVEATVATHTSQINQIAESVDTLRIDMAVVKSQGEAAKNAAQSASDKLDRVLAAVYRMQGSSRDPGGQK